MPSPKITSFAVSADAPFLLAYYVDDGSGRLNPPLHVVRYDRERADLKRADLRDVPAILNVYAQGGRPFMKQLEDSEEKDPALEARVEMFQQSLRDDYLPKQKTPESLNMLQPGTFSAIARTVGAAKHGPTALRAALEQEWKARRSTNAPETKADN